MSEETNNWLNENTLIGFTEQRGTAWHARAGHDNHYPGAIPIEEVQRRLFNWEVLEADVLFENMSDATSKKTNRITGAPNMKLVYRSDTGAVLGEHSQGWKLHSYSEWLLDNLANLIDDNIQIGSAVLLKGGAVAAVQIEAPETVETVTGEKFRPFIAATTSMNGKLASTYKRGATRIVCDNTMGIFFSEAGSAYKIRHTKNNTFKVATARDILGMLFEVQSAVDAEIREMTERTITDSQWSQFLGAHVPIAEDAGKKTVTIAEGKREELRALWSSDPRVEPWRGTAWGVLQAVSTHAQHVRGRVHQGTTRTERNYLDFLDGKSSEVERVAMETLSKVLVAA